MRLIYLAHPYGGDPANLVSARMWFKWTCTHFRASIAPVMDWLIYCEVLPESKDNREYGISCDLSIVRRCDHVWLVGGRVSSGMRLEAQAAMQIGRPVYDLTGLGDHPPAESPPLSAFKAWQG